jgi:hypothetical protein
LPRLYVANVTQQTQQFTYWVPETPRSLVQEIPIGGQVQIATRDLPKEVIDSIIDQHRVYGICTYAEGMRDPNFSGIVYSVDRPVSLSNLYELANKRQQSIIQLGKRLREEAAIATDQAIVDVLQQSGMPARLQELEMSVEEKSRDPRDDSPEISEGVRVSRRTPEPNSTPRGRGRARAATRRASVVALFILSIFSLPLDEFKQSLNDMKTELAHDADVQASAATALHTLADHLTNGAATATDLDELKTLVTGMSSEMHANADSLASAIADTSGGGNSNPDPNPAPAPTSSP